AEGLDGLDRRKGSTSSAGVGGLDGLDRRWGSRRARPALGDSTGSTGGRRQGSTASRPFDRPRTSLRSTAGGQLTSCRSGRAGASSATPVRANSVHIWRIPLPSRETSGNDVPSSKELGDHAEPGNRYGNSAACAACKGFSGGPPWN